MEIFELVEVFNKLNETHFIRDDNFINHYDKHVSKDYNQYFLELEDELFEPMTQDEYDEYAHKLSQAPVFTSNVDSDYDVVGFVDDRGRILKYRKSLSELVVYVAEKDDAATISYYKLKTTPNHNRYRRLLNRYYKREIEPLDDYYNA